MVWETLAIVPVLALLLMAHELGHLIAAMRSGVTVQEFGIGFPPRLASIRRHGILFSLNVIPLGAFVRMLGEEDPSLPGGFASKAKRARALILAAGPAMNFLLAVVLFASAYVVGWPTATRVEAEIFKVVPDSPAAVAGLQPGDVVKAIDGRPVSSLQEFVAYTRSRLGRPVTLQVSRGSALLQATLTPRTTWPEDQGPMGVGIRGRVLKVEPVSYPLLSAVTLGFARAAQVIGFTLAAPVWLLQGAILPDMLRPIGPVGIAGITSQAAEYVANTGWWFPLLSLTGTLSAGLAIANILPFPALDGGRLLFVLLEAVRGKRVAPEKEGLVHFVGMALLIAMMVIISYYDLVSPLPPIQWGPK